MDSQLLLDVHASQPFMLLSGDAERASEEAIAQRNAGLDVRAVRGRKMRSVDALFDEVASALQFPYYFGENWPAFDECVTDLDWAGSAAGIVIIVLDAIEVLSGEPPADLTTLVSVFTRAAKTYAEPIALGEWWDRPSVPFHVLLQANDQDHKLVRSRWEGAGATFLVSGGT